MEKRNAAPAYSLRRMDIELSTCFIAVDDHDRALAFYRDVLGLEVRNDVAFEGMRWVTVGSPSQPGVEIVLEPPLADPSAPPADRQAMAELLAKGQLRGVIFKTEDVDATFEQIRAGGGEVLQEPIDQPYGVRDCAFRDPAGNMLRFNQPRNETMSIATRTDAQSPAPHVADTHDLIRVLGARVNNLKDVSVEIPKRRLTVFTGVSGSGKSSLVFGTIAAESQRLINETYSAFVQGFMPTLARPDVDVLDGITTAISVDQERMGSNPRSTVGTVTDTDAMLRILFSRLAQPHIGSPGAYSFNVASAHGSGGFTVERGDKTITKSATFSRVGGMCPRCEGRGSISDFDLTALYDDSKSLNEGALTIPGYSMEGWYGRIYRGCGYFDPDKPIKKFNKRELHDLLYREPTKIKVEGINLTYAGLIPQIQKSFLVQGRRGDAAAHPRVRGAGGRVHHVPGLRRHPAQRGGPVVEDRRRQHRRRLRDGDPRPGRVGEGP